MMRALLGRTPKGVSAKLRHYRLYIEPWHAIPPVVQAKLIDYWKPRRFQRYVIRRRRGYEVEGIAWNITPTERRIIREWDMSDGRWTEEQVVVAHIVGGQKILAETDVRSLWTDDLLPHSKESTFLNNKTAMLIVAERVREQVSKYL